MLQAKIARRLQHATKIASVGFSCDNRIRDERDTAQLIEFLNDDIIIGYDDIASLCLRI